MKLSVGEGNGIEPVAHFRQSEPHNLALSQAEGGTLKHNEGEKKDEGEWMKCTGDSFHKTSL